MVGRPGAPQLDLMTYGKENKAYKKDVYLFPIQLDEKLRVLHLPALSAVLTVFAQEDEVMLVLTSSLYFGMCVQTLPLRCTRGVSLQFERKLIFISCVLENSTNRCQD